VYVLGAVPAANDLKRFVGNKIRARGINASKTVDGHLESASVFAPSMNEIYVLETSAPNRAPVPVASIGSLLNLELGPWTNDPVHINGLVVSYQPGKSVVVKDPTGVIRAQVIQLTQIQPDERVDVWGFLQVSPTEVFLNNAYFEVAQPPPQNDSLTIADGAAHSTNRPALLTQVSDILKLRREQSAEHIPVRLRGVLTYADADWRNAFVQDKGGAVYVDLNQSDVHSGEYVELTGHTSSGGFAPEILGSSITVLGETNFPTPAKVDLEDLANGRLDAHWVEMEGVVRRADQQWGHLSLSLMTPQGRFKVVIPNFDNTTVPTNLIDALVSVTGACASELNVRRQLSGITLHAPSLAQVKIIEPPSADPFSITTTPIDAVATFDPDRLAGRRVKVRGVVTLQIPAQGFIVEDASGGIRVLTRQASGVQVGDIVDVLGFPVIGDFSPYLEEASFRKTGTGPLPAARKMSAEQILLQGTNDNLVVEIKARLLQSVPRSANPQLVLQDGPIIFTAHLETQNRKQDVPALPSGSLVRLTGVCSIQGGERHEPATFRLLLRQPADIELLETPPWWTSRHTFMLVGGMMLAFAFALAWVALLRRQVSRQTQLIRQKLEDEAALEERYINLFENANDMVYTLDLNGRITTVNQTGERLLQRKRTDILGRKIVNLIVSEEQAAAQNWLDQVLTGTAPPTAEWDFVVAPEQRVKLEISTRLIESDGQFVEVEGIARDITERKRLEREILEISNREQRRIGHDLHDGVCQQLAGIAFMSHTLANRLQQKGNPEFAQAEGISTLINTAISQTRGVARGLFPVRLEENGLASALEELATNSAELFKVNCRFIAGEPAAIVENEIALHLYYIALEAVANAAKHSRAENITIYLGPADGRYALEVKDDGCGFTPESVAQTGMGVRIMHYRARVIGATLNLQSRPGSGTHIVCLFQTISRESAVENGRKKAPRAMNGTRGTGASARENYE
jgi:PAS domain S-box-containing protein